MKFLENMKFDQINPNNLSAKFLKVGNIFLRKTRYRFLQTNSSVAQNKEIRNLVWKFIVKRTFFIILIFPKQTGL